MAQKPSCWIEARSAKRSPARAGPPKAKNYPSAKILAIVNINDTASQSTKCRDEENESQPGRMH